MVRTWKWMGLALAGVALGCGAAPPSKEGLHEACTPGGQCASGQRCLEYTGFAGQPLASCEIACASQGDCPAPLICTTVSDGPNEMVCH